MNGTPLICSWCFKPASRYVRRLGAKTWDLSCSDQHAENLPIITTSIAPDGSPLADADLTAVIPASSPLSSETATESSSTPAAPSAPDTASSGAAAKPAPLTSPLASLFSRKDEPAS